MRRAPRPFDGSNTRQWAKIVQITGPACDEPARDLAPACSAPPFDDPDFQRLTPFARLVLVVLRLCAQAGPAVIFRYYPAVLCQTGLSAPEFEAALEELEQPAPRQPWIYRESVVVWVRNGLTIPRSASPTRSTGKACNGTLTGFQTWRSSQGSVTITILPSLGSGTAKGRLRLPIQLSPPIPTPTPMQIQTPSVSPSAIASLSQGMSGNRKPAPVEAAAIEAKL